MQTFLVYCIPCAIIGMFMALLITAGSKTKVGHAVGFIILSLVLTAFFAGMFTLEHMGDESTWNNGKCIICGGEYNFVNADRYRNHTTYYYECEDCGHIIELGHAAA